MEYSPWPGTTKPSTGPTQDHSRYGQGTNRMHRLGVRDIDRLALTREHPEGDHATPWPFVDQDHSRHLRAPFPRSRRGSDGRPGRAVSERHFQRRAAYAQPERTPAVRPETPETAKCLFKLGICLSGWGDLNSRPSVPQTDALTKLRHSPRRSATLPAAPARQSRRNQSGDQKPETLNKAPTEVHHGCSGEHPEMPRHLLGASRRPASIGHPLST